MKRNLHGACAGPGQVGVHDVTVDLITLPNTQQGRGLELGNLPRNGAVVQARVIAMLDGGVARLAILGQTIDVNAPRTFQAGTSLAVAVVRDGANLKLFLQQEAQPAPQQAPRGSASALPADAAGLLPAAVKAAIIGALLDSGSNPRDASTAAEGPSAQSEPAASAALAGGTQPEAWALAQYRLGTMPQAASSLDDPAPASPSASSSAHAAQRAAALPGAPANPVLQNSAQAILVPFQLPQMAQPIMLRVEQDQEDGTDGNGAPATKRTWTVNVTLDAGALGLVHIGIGLREGSVSVRLSAGTPQGAGLFSTWLPELKTSLEQADFVAGELSAVLARPAELPAGDAGQSRSYTI